MTAAPRCFRPCPRSRRRCGRRGRPVARLLLLCLAALAAAAGPVGGDEADPRRQWGQWRGPRADGSAPHADPPLRWGPETNVRWTADLPGEGASTPIVWEDRVLVLAAAPTGEPAAPPPLDPRRKTRPPAAVYQFDVLCFDRGSGALRWRRTAAREAPHEGRHPTNTYAASSPATDGRRVIALFGSRGLFAYDLQGRPLWQRDLGRMRTRYGWGEAVSPVLYKDRVVVNWDQEDDSYLYVLDATSGATLWRKERPGEVTSWNTPLCTAIDGRDVVVVNGTGSARAYDLLNGEVLWQCGGQTVNAIPSPLRIDDAVICMSGYRGSAARCIPLDASGDVTGTSQVLWRYDQDTPYVPSPALWRNRLYFTKSNVPILTVLDARSGVPLTAARRLDSLGTLYASPLAAAGRLYFVDRQGVALVLDAESLETLAVNRLDGAFDASPAAVGRQLFLRSGERLWCLEDEDVGAEAPGPATAPRRPRGP